MPYREPTKGELFRKKLAIYLMGVAIGLIMLGFFHQARQRAAQQYQQQQAQQAGQSAGSESAAPAKSPAPAPAPTSSGSAE
ncbi:MAG: hypothetical protein AAGG07_04800 [Planctomycetota bacterium]